MTSDLELASFEDILEELDKRTCGLVVGYVPREALTDAKGVKFDWVITSHGPLPIRMALAAMIVQHAQERQKQELTTGLDNTEDVAT